MVYKIKILITVLILMIIGEGIWIGMKYRAMSQTSAEISISTPTPIPTSTPLPTSPIPDITTIASNLKIPWDIAFLPEGGILVTERGGDLIEINKDGQQAPIKLPRTVPKGEGGLLGITLHPDFKNNRELYFYMTTQNTKAGTENAVFRYKFENGSLSDEKTIIKDIPGALYHDGGRLEFGPDGDLYITTGDAETSSIAQDLKSLGGKILRLKDDGSIPSDNPFGTPVYSYGHRNPQGLTWDDQGNLWETEHGRSGVLSGMDELNIIEKGKNYGWPIIEGDKTKTGMVTPVMNSGPDKTWAPASALYYKGSIFVGGLKGEALYEAVLQDGKVSQFKEHFFKQFGRIRTVRLGPDGMFYITTSNRDDRGTPKEGDDKIIRINPNALK